MILLSVLRCEKQIFGLLKEAKITTRRALGVPSRSKNRRVRQQERLASEHKEHSDNMLDETAELLRSFRKNS
jgi:hypothetical protein